MVLRVTASIAQRPESIIKASDRTPCHDARAAKEKSVVFSSQPPPVAAGTSMCLWSPSSGARSVMKINRRSLA